MVNQILIYCCIGCLFSYILAVVVSKRSHYSLCDEQTFPSWAECQKITGKYREKSHSQVLTHDFGAHFKNTSNNSVQKILLETLQKLEEHNCSRAYGKAWNPDPNSESGIHLTFAYFCNATMEEVRRINHVIEKHRHQTVSLKPNRMQCVYKPSKPYMSLMLTFDPHSEERLVHMSKSFESEIRDYVPTYNIAWPRIEMGPFHMTLGAINRSGCDIDELMPIINRKVPELSHEFTLFNMEMNNKKKLEFGL